MTDPRSSASPASSDLASTPAAPPSDDRRLRLLLEQAPGLVAVLRGPEHVFEFANAAYRALLNDRPLLGRTVAEALPEVVEQGFIDLLDAVYTTGEPFVGRAIPVQLRDGPDQAPREVYADFIYQPVREDDGSVSGIFVQGHDVTEAARATQALREREAALRMSEEALLDSQGRYRDLVGAIEEGFALCELLVDEAGAPADYRILESNAAFGRLAGLPGETAGRRASDLAPVEAARLARYARAALDREPSRFAQGSLADGRECEVFVSPAGDAGSRRFVVLYTDVTARRRVKAELRAREAHQGYLLQLNQVLQPLSDPGDLLHAAGQTLATHLGVRRAGYAEDAGDGETVVVTRVYQTSGPSIEGVYRYSDYGAPLLRALRAGEAVAQPDIARDTSLPDDVRAAHAALGLAATVNVPLLKDGRLRAILFAHHDAPRAWTDDEVQLMRETAEVTWASVERARAEAALRQSEGRYRTLFESIDEGYCVLDLIYDADGRPDVPVDWRYAITNRVFEEQSGLVGAEGRRIREFAPDHESFWFEMYGEIDRTGVPARVESEARALDRWFDVYAFRMAPGRIGVLFRDITDKRRSEAALAAAARRDSLRVTLADALRPLSDTSDVRSTACRVLGTHLGVDRCVYFEVDGGDYVADCDYTRDPDAESLTGRFPIDAFGDALAAAYRAGHTVAEADIAASETHTEAIRAAYAQIGIGAFVGVPIVKEGVLVAGLTVHSIAPRAWTPDEITLIEDAAERMWGAVEHARAEAALRESEARYRTLFDHIDEGFALCELHLDADGRPVDHRFLQVNPAFERLTGLTGVEGRLASEAIPGNETIWTATFARVVETGESVRLEQGSEPLGRVYDVFAARVGEAHERRFALIFNDVTERRRAEQALRDSHALLEQRVAERTDALRVANDALVHRNRELQDFAYVASHDLQEPLRKITTFASMLATDERERLSDDGRHAVERMGAAAERMSRLIRDLLAFSRVETKGLSFEDVDLDAALAGALVDLDVRLAETGGRVEADPLGVVRGDASQLRQVLLNLVGNALKFHRPGEAPVVRVTRRDTPAGVELAVEDNGIGFEAQHADRIFAPFQRLHGRSEYEGTGIGLAIVRKIAERHGGDVTATSVVGSGSRFVVTLPARGASAA